LPRMLFDFARAESDRELRLIRIGVAVHAIADTFSHYGFSGRWDDANDVRGIWLKENGDWDHQTIMSWFYDIGLPRIGHAEAGKYPDCPYSVWKYGNAKGKEVVRNNTEDTIACAEYLFKLLKMACPGSEPNASLSVAQPEDFNNICRLIRSEGDLDTRSNRWREYTGVKEYSKYHWREQALTGAETKWDTYSPARLKSLSFQARKGFYKSAWSNFHRAAFKQRCRVQEWLS